MAWKTSKERCPMCMPDGHSVFRIDALLAIKTCNNCGYEKRQYRRVSKQIREREELLARLTTGDLSKAP